VATIFFETIEKSDARTITRDAHESGNKHTCEFQRMKKFLVAFTNETYLRMLQEQCTFLGMSLT